MAGKWIFQLVQMQKITFAAARAELVKTGENLCRAWLEANQVYVHATQPLWVQEEDDF